MVVNTAATGGPIGIKIDDNAGTLISTKSASISAGGMYVDNDIRNSFPGTFGQIVIEPGEGTQLNLVANSLIKSANGTGGFFQAFVMPNTNLVSHAGIWEGPVTGTLMNARLKIKLNQ